MIAMGDVGRLVGGRYRIDRELFRGQGTQSLLVTDLRNGRPSRSSSVGSLPVMPRQTASPSA